MSKKYEVGELYDRSQHIDLLCLVLFVVNCILTVVNTSADDPSGLVVVVQVLTAVLFVVLDLYNEYWCWFDAESANRKHLIENSFGLDITGRTSEGYYNNRFKPSLQRYLTSALESMFFTKCITDKMRRGAMIKLLVSLALLCLILIIQPSIISISDSVQAILSAYLLEDAVCTFVFHDRVCRLYDSSYNLLVTCGVTSFEQVALLISDVQEYECTKAHYRVRVDKKIFEDMNPTLSAQWDLIQRKVVIAPELSDVIPSNIQ